LDIWLKQLEVCFGIYQIQETQQISFSCLNMNMHALLWLESYMDAVRIRKNHMVIKWEDFKELIKSQFYPIGYKEDKS